jgi:hypothetical protein
MTQGWKGLPGTNTQAYLGSFISYKENKVLWIPGNNYWSGRLSTFDLLVPALSLSHHLVFTVLSSVVTLASLKCLLILINLSAGNIFFCFSQLWPVFLWQSWCGWQQVVLIHLQTNVCHSDRVWDSLWARKVCQFKGRAKANGRKPKSCLSRVFNLSQAVIL